MVSGFLLHYTFFLEQRSDFRLLHENILIIATLKKIKLLPILLEIYDSKSNEILAICACDFVDNSQVFQNLM